MTDQEKRQKQLKSDIILMAIGYILLIFFAINLISVASAYENIDITKLETIVNETIISIQHKPLLIPRKEDLEILTLITTFYGIYVLYVITTRKKLMLGKEHGTAEWAGKNDIKKIMDKDDKSNIIFTNSEKMSLDTRKTRKNLNILTIGGSGSGKTRFFVKPNLMQSNTSYVITDPKGELLRDTGKLLEREGYEIKVFNLIDMEYSHCYNPFAYIRKESDVLKVINTLIRNTNSKGSGGGDPFWEKSETALLQALFFFIYFEFPKEEQNFQTVLELLRLAEVKEDEEDYQSDLDIMFETLKEEKPEHIALKQYAIFKQSAGKTAKSILVSVGVRLSVFNIEDIGRLTAKDDLDLGSLGDKKTALYVIIPDSDTTFNFLVAMMYSQLFDSLYYAADFKNKGRLKHHVRFMLDEFANIGQIPDFDKFIATMRSREISVSIILQNLSQLKNMYKDNWESIIGNCDTVLFLGGKEPRTLEYVSKALGKQTIDTKNINYSKGRNSSTSYNYGILGRDLMTPDEIGKMPDSDCILLIRGMKPFYSNKFKIEKHKRYKYLFDTDDKNFYDYKNITDKSTIVLEKEHEAGEAASENISDTTNVECEITNVEEAYNMRSLELELDNINKLAYELDYEEL